MGSIAAQGGSRVRAIVRLPDVRLIDMLESLGFVGSETPEQGISLIDLWVQIN